MGAGTVMTVLTLLLMALATYCTRIGGYLLLNRQHIAPRTAKVMEAAPGCVLIAVLAPDFASGRMADLVALTVTIVAAMRCSLLVTVLVGIGSGWFFRMMLPG